MSAIQVTQEGVENPLVSCNECDAVWHSVKCERCPLCGQNVGVPYILSKQQSYVLLGAVSLLNDEHIARASEYETWAFGEILRENVPWYDADCRRTIQACYLALLKKHIALTDNSQPRTLTKIEFAMKFFEEAYLQAPEDQMMYKQEDEEDHHDSDVDEWW
jgi:hypothetical protein